MRLLTPSRAIALVIASAGAVAACGSEEMFEPQLASSERLIDREAIAQLVKDDEGLEQLAVVGDLDGDGIDDAVLRTFNVKLSMVGNSESIEDRSVVYILYGGGTVTGKIDLSSLPSLTDAGASEGGIAAVGDVDGDGLADFVIGAARTPGCGNPDIPHSNDHPYGGGYLVYGSGKRLTGATPIGDISAFLRDPTPCTVTGPVSALGDLDGDGKADFAIGKVPLQANQGPTEIFVFYGRGERLSGTVDLTAADAVIRDSTPDPNYFLSPSVDRIGDVDGDGHDDFVLQRQLSQSTADVRLVRGSATRLKGTVAPTDITQSLLASNDYCLFDTRIGKALGDLDGDGFDDFSLVGCQSVPGDYRSATVHHVFYGRAGGFPAQVNIDNADATLATGAVGRLTLATRDLDGDGILDLVVGDPGMHEGNGAVHLIKGSSVRLSGTIDPRALAPSALGPTYVGLPRRVPVCGYILSPNCVAHDELGVSLDLGDLTGDHRVDILVEASAQQFAVPELGVHGSAVGHVFLVSPPPVTTL
jgi:hypothetical protein